MNSKEELIKEYIEKCDNCDSVKYEKLITEIVATFDNEIKDITSGLDSYSIVRLYGSNKPCDYIGDLQLLKTKLRNYLATIELNSTNIKNQGQTFNINQTVSVNISFEQTIENIDKLSGKNLSDDEKEKLITDLTKLKLAKDKNKIWDNAKNILKWIADKSVEVGIAALPYITDIIKNA